MTASSIRKPVTPILLVHGAFHGAWCWTKLIPILSELGIESKAIDLPLTSVRDDENCIRNALDHLSHGERQVAVLAHSYGGTPASAAVTSPKVNQIVFLSTLVPSLEDPTQAGHHEAAAIPFLVIDGDTCWIDPGQAHQRFYGHCSADDAEWAIQSLRPMSTSLFKERPSNDMWRTVLSTYVICTDDKVLQQTVQESQARRTERRAMIHSDHSPFLSHPDELAKLLHTLLTPGPESD